jgi:glucose-6-phosphate-specific signal transduction histidine kinase
LENLDPQTGMTFVLVTHLAPDLRSFLSEIVECYSQLQLKVMDFGVGFDQEGERSERGLGMISTQERARLAGGSFSVQSALGQEQL